VSHAAVESEVLFWFVVVLTLLLLMFIGAVVWGRPEVTGSPQSPRRNLPTLGSPPAHLLPASGPPAVVLAGAAAPPCALVMGPGMAVVESRSCWWPGGRRYPAARRGVGAEAARPGRQGRRAPAGRPWPGAWESQCLPGTATGPGPGAARRERVPSSGLSSPGLDRARSAQIGQGRCPPGGRVGAHRRGSYHGAHRAGTSSRRAHGFAGLAGRHRAAVR
jgi:hypothetical protein